MKKIQIINKVNSENNSLTTLKVDDLEIALSEKELKLLFEQLYENRSDIFEDVVSSLFMEIESLKEELNDAEEQISNLEDELKFFNNDED